MSYEITGKLVNRSETKQVTDKFKKRDFVIETESQAGDRTFTDYVKFQLMQDKCEIISKFNKDDMIKVSFNIKGNKADKDGNTIYFTNLDAWRIEKVSDEYSEEFKDTARKVANEIDADDDDLPF